MLLHRLVPNKPSRMKWTPSNIASNVRCRPSWIVFTEPDLLLGFKPSHLESSSLPTWDSCCSTAFLSCLRCAGSKNMHDLGVPEGRIENDWDNGFVRDVHPELVTGLHYEQLGPFYYHARELGALTCPSRHRFNRHCHCHLHPFSVKMLHKSSPLPLRHCRLSVLPLSPATVPHLADIPLSLGCWVKPD